MFYHFDFRINLFRYPVCHLRKYFSYLLLDLLLLHLFYSVFKVQLVGSSGLEPPTLRLSGARSSLLSYEPILIGVFFLLSLGGDEEIRTLDPLLAGQVLSQLSYTPIPLGPLSRLAP